MIQVVNNIPRFSESIESVFFGDRTRAQSLQIKRKPVGSGSLMAVRIRAPCRNFGIKIGREEEKIIGFCTANRNFMHAENRAMAK